MDAALYSMLAIRYLASMHNAAQLSGTCWSVFAGTAVSTHWRSSIGKFVKDNFDIPLELKTTLIADSDDAKMRSLLQQHPAVRS